MSETSEVPCRVQFVGFAVGRLIYCEPQVGMALAGLVRQTSQPAARTA